MGTCTFARVLKLIATLIPVRLVAILPWFTLLFTLIASGVLLVAALRTYNAQSEIEAQSYQARNASTTKVETEKVALGGDHA